MESIKVFISYSSVQKNIGGRFKACLTSYCGYETFIAHSDIPGSLIWEDEIIKAIESADFFIPLISDAFKVSDFTDQETGIAVSLKKKIIPIKLEDINPYGFINKYQAMKYKKYQAYDGIRDNIKELVLTIAQIVLNDKQYHEKAINSTVYAFCNSSSFDTTNATIKIMLNYDHFVSRHLDQIGQAIKRNPQIAGAFGLLAFREFLHRKYKIAIDS